MRTLTFSDGSDDHTLDDVQAVQFVANLLEISEYKVFHLAYENWFGKKLSDRSMDYRFDNYLEDDIVPLWVWDFVQSVFEKYQKKILDPREFGIEQKVLTGTDRWVGFLYVAIFSLVIVLYCWLLSNVEPYVEMSFG